MSKTALPAYVTLWDDDEPSVDIPPSSRFTWRPRARELSVGTKATPELLAELAATGAIDTIATLQISEWSKAMTGLPPLPDTVARSLRRVEINCSKFVDWTGLYALPAVQELVLQEKVSVFPDGVSGLISLRLLDVYGRRLKALPSDLDAISNLAVLKLYSPISTLPDKLGQLPLTHLHVKGAKKIKALPDSIGDCATLRELVTLSLPIRSLPDALYTSNTLEILSIETGKLSKLGPSIHWPALRSLTLSGSFKKWPDDVHMPALEELELHDGIRATQLPDIFHGGLKHVRTTAVLETVDPRLATLEDWLHNRHRKGVKLNCTAAAYEALSEKERAAFGARLKVSPA